MLSDSITIFKGEIEMRIKRECDDRMAKGLLQYGEYNPQTDGRNMLKEIQEECIDIINYSRMHRQKKPDFDYAIENLAKEIYRLTFTVE